MKNSVILLNALPDKKIKSIGNKCLLPINKKINLLDYHINTIYRIYKNPEIIIVCGFDTKKIKKYINDKYKNIKYIDHDVNEYTNIGESLVSGLGLVTNDNCLIINANNILHKKAIDKIIQNNDEFSYVLTKKICGDIGFISDVSKKIINCYYGLPNCICEVLYINKEQFKDFLKIKNHDISKMYLFEIINYCISMNINIQSINIPDSAITLLENLQNIKRLNKICRI